MSDDPVVELIRLKREGAALSDEQVESLVRRWAAGEVPDEQMAAFCMAVVFRGMAPRELSRFTRAMASSGEDLDLSGVGRPTVDKHSTGGVGDGTSLVLVPLVAACGAAVPQLSGRGLGHTGGTLDKLEAVPGVRTSFTRAQIEQQLADVGMVICAASADLAPADRTLYALRDVTGTVEAVPLIASSIMSKKMAERTQGLVLDVKVGSGAFLPDPERARELARTMVGLGTAAGVATRALITDMDAPLGRTAGNAVEVRQALDVLEGGGPEDYVEVVLALAREMVDVAGLDVDPADALADGRAMDAWRTLVAAQGGDPDAALPQPREVETISAPDDGVLQRVDARAVGTAAWRLGAGRARKEDPVSATAGVRWFAAPGDAVSRRQPLFELHTDDPDRLAGARRLLEEAVTIGDEAPEPRPLVHERVLPEQG